MKKIENYLNNLITGGRLTLLRHLPLSSCVSSTRFAIEYLNSLGITAKPQPVHVISFFPPKIIGRKIGGNPEGWNGHLVALVGDDEYVLDMSLDQAGFTPIYFPIIYYRNGYPDFPILAKYNQYDILYLIDHDAENFTKTEAWQERWKIPYKEFVNG